MQFDDQQVWRLNVTDTSHFEGLQRIVEELNLDLWSNLRTGPVDIRVSLNQHADKLENYLKTLQPPVSHSVMIDDVQDLVETERQQQESLKGGGFFAKYHAYDVIIKFMEELQKAKPDLVEIFTVGKTYEKRDIRGIKIGSKSESSKKEIVFHGGIHAREWIGPAVTLYMANELITKYDTDPRVKEMVDGYSWTIVPVLNVDGYVFTHRSNRMWRKNRQPNRGSFCIGTDPNRNWGYKWNKGGGSSSNPCSEAYQGPKPFSAPETRAMADYILSRMGHIALYIDFHAYSQLWMYPYGADCNELPPEYEKVDAAARTATKALTAVHGT
ncbi:hypothetical protein HK102_003690, partial [Quaeritorhiza haematococci]